MKGLVNLMSTNIEGTKIIERDIEREMKKSFIDYSMSVIVSRALPDVRDGLKPVHRRILYTMHENGLTPDKAYRKCADTVGSVLGRYHPHGDASVYDALVRMAQDFSLRYPIVDGHGNFGSVDGDPPAAYRYTEARMSKISLEMLTDIEKETIDYVGNYDDRLQEPTVLPARFPNLLVNGSTGIAVGMATNIPPHNLKEVVDGICLLIDNPEAELYEIMEIIKGPDFPTAGIIMGMSGIRAAYATGRGKIALRAKAEIQDWKNGRFRIVVTELPYQVNKARLIENIAGMVKDKRIEGISDLRDESDRKGMHFVIELKREANPQVVLNQLYRFTQMQETVGVIMLALVDGQPKILTLKECLEHYIKFQCVVIRRRTEFDLRKAKEREHILEGLKMVIDFMDEVIRIIRNSNDIPQSKANLIERFGIDDIQASAITAMRLGQLSGMERQKILDELDALLLKIAELIDILSSESKILAILKEEIGEIRRRFGDDRRTEIQQVSGEVDIEDLIPEEDCVVTLTHFGYIKRQPVEAYKLQKRGGRGVSGMKQREEDFVEEMFISSTHENILFITNMGRMYKLKCYEIPEGSKTARGMNIVNLLPITGDEKIACMLKVKEFEDDSFIVMATRRGLVKRTKLSAYKNVRKNGLIAVSLNEGDELASVLLTNGQSELLLATKNGMSLRFSEQAVRPLSRQARGVKGIKLRGDDEIIGMAGLSEDAYVMTVTDKGLGRRTSAAEYRLQSRGGFGKINYKTTEARGNVAGIRLVTGDEDLILIADDGVIIRIRVSDVNSMSRYAGGVRVMRLTPEAKLVTFAVAEHDEDEEVETVEAAAEAAETGDEAELMALEQELEAADAAAVVTDEEPSEEDAEEETEE